METTTTLRREPFEQISTTIGTPTTMFKKRRFEQISEEEASNNNHNNNNNKRASLSSCSQAESTITHYASSGLDWDLVKTLDQTQAYHLPAPFRPSASLKYTGEYYDQPVPIDYTDLGDFTQWVLARTTKMVVSNSVAQMMDDPDLSPKWTITPNTHYKNQLCSFKEIKLGLTPTTNHEAAYAQMCGIVLPPEQSCIQCQAKNGKFQHCVVVPGYLNGACANCHYNSAGRKCSHRPATIKPTTKRPKTDGTPATLPASTSTPDIPLPLPLPHHDVKSVVEEKPSDSCFEERLKKIEGILHQVLAIVTEYSKRECNMSPLSKS